VAPASRSTCAAEVWLHRTAHCSGVLPFWGQAEEVSALTQSPSPPGKHTRRVPAEHPAPVHHA